MTLALHQDLDDAYAFPIPKNVLIGNFFNIPPQNTLNNLAIDNWLNLHSVNPLDQNVF